MKETDDLIVPGDLYKSSNGQYTFFIVSTDDAAQGEEHLWIHHYAPLVTTYRTYSITPEIHSKYVRFSKGIVISAIKHGGWKRL